MLTYSPEYVEYFRQGAFHGTTDPWAEAARYFHQLHGELISHLLTQLQTPLLLRGYIAGRETSLQIAQNRQPDVYIQQCQPKPTAAWDYALAAEAVEAAIGELSEEAPPELDAVYIKSRADNRLVTVIEVISPSNKTEWQEMESYQARRGSPLGEEIHVVEIDLTRSIKRLVHDAHVHLSPYHVAVHLYDQATRLITMEVGEPLKRCAIPLQGEVIPADLQIAYDYAYGQTSLAGHILADTHYALSALPFPSLLSPAKQEQCVQQAEHWLATLAQLGKKS